MENWNALALASALGQAAFSALLRGAAMVLATLGLLLMLIGMGMLSSIGEASEAMLTSDEQIEEILLMPAAQPSDSM